nr:hypothetical protein [Micromonospora provocatoris]
MERRDQPIDEGHADLLAHLRAGGPAVPLDLLCDRLLAAAHQWEDDVALLALRAG